MSSRPLHVRIEMRATDSTDPAPFWSALGPRPPSSALPPPLFSRLRLDAVDVGAALGTAHALKLQVVSHVPASAHVGQKRLAHSLAAMAQEIGEASGAHS